MLLDLVKPKSNGTAEAVFSAPNTAKVRRCASWLASRIESARHAREDELDTETVTIEPALAELMLERNTGNRQCSARHVAHLADAITSGRWRLTGQGVSFSRSGRLLDGQHRLAAIVAAGVPAKMRVTFGEADDVFDVLDTGRARTAGQVLGISGIKNYNVIASMIRQLDAIERGYPANLVKIDNDVTREIASADQAALERAATMGVTARSHLHAPPTPLATGFYLIAKKSKNADRLEEFVERLSHGDMLDKRNPILTLRTMLTTGPLSGTTAKNEGGHGAKSRTAAITASMILAWNRWIAGRSAAIQALTWTLDKPYPEPE